MIYSVTRFVALHLFTRARASQSDFAGFASVLQPLARLGFPGDNCASSASRRGPHGSPEAWKGWLAARRHPDLQAGQSPSSCARLAHASIRFARPSAKFFWHRLHASNVPPALRDQRTSTSPTTKKKAAANARAQRAAAAALSKQQDGQPWSHAPARVRPQHRKTAAADARAVVQTSVPRLQKWRRCRRPRRRPRH